MVRAWSWAAAALACAIIPAHCASMTAPKNNLALEGRTQTNLFRFGIPEGDLSGLEDDISLQKRQEALPSLLYRGSGSSPEDVKACGGFIPRQEGGPMINETFSLQSHQRGDSRTAYTSTSRSFGVALCFSVKEASEGWIYKIHPTPNMIDLRDSGFRLAHGPEEEFSALGGIRYDQIEAWMPMSIIALKRESTMESIAKNFHEFEGFSAEYPDKKWTVNPEYNQKYESLAASPGQPQLAGDPKNLAKYNNRTLEEYATEFMQKTGAAVGWDGKFPLSSLKQTASCLKSSANLGIWEKMAKFCEPGPDGKKRYGMGKKHCGYELEQCLWEEQGSPGANWDKVTKCMDTKFLPAAH